VSAALATPPPHVLETSPTLFGDNQAAFSPGKAHRYTLTRIWGSGGTWAVWVMLNPSTADAFADDPTIAKCTGFSRRWGLDGLAVVNLYALRATDPRELARHPDPAGPGNDWFIRDKMRPCSLLVAAWGAHPMAVARRRKVTEGAPDGPPRDQEVMGILGERGGVSCLGITKEGHPKHPLYVPFSAGLVQYGGTP
jgi:hypothetical protein